MNARIAATRLFTILFCFLVAACDRSAGDGATRTRGPTVRKPHAALPIDASPVASAGARRPEVHNATGTERPLELARKLTHPGAPLIVAIGDLHGDLAATRRALRLAGAIDESDRWIGGALVVVQTGDQLDRGDQDREVFELLERVQAEAASAGGALLMLQGNHEVMNVAADLRYVTQTSADAFAREGGREAAFAPGGPFARRLAQRPLLMKVGDSVFVHGGILSKHLTYGLDRMDAEVSAWMRGELLSPPDILMVADGPIWTRLYSLAPEDCEQLRTVLARLGAVRMVVGHTVQASGINAGCGGLVWRIDTGMSAFYGGPTEVLEIRGEVLTVRRAP